MSRIIAVACLGLLVGCAAESPVSIEPEVMVATILAGDDQTALGNLYVSIPPTVLVTVNGEPRAGVTVLFSVTSGGGTLTNAQVTTEFDGTANVGTWRLGRPGPPQQVLAVVKGPNEVRLEFDATATTGPLYLLYPVYSNFDLSIVGQSTAPFRIKAVDLAFNPIAGVPLAWRVPPGSGHLSTAGTLTGADGTASGGTWVLGTLAGDQRIYVRADYPGGKEFEVWEYAAPGPAAIIERLVTDPQEAKAGTNVPLAPQVKVYDQYRNLVGTPRQVVFTVVAGNGSVDNTHQITNAASVAGVARWTLGPVPGENRLRATAGSVSVEFTATGTP